MIALAAYFFAMMVYVLELVFEQLSIANEIKMKCRDDGTSKSVKEIYDDVLLK